jgi:hypothetical protein
LFVASAAHIESLHAPYYKRIFAASNRVQEPTGGEDNENNEENGNNEDNDKSTSSTSYTVPSLCPCGLGFLSPVLLRRGAVLSPIYLVLQKRHFQFHPCESAPAAYAILQPPENPGIPLFYTTSLPEAMEAFDGIISDYRDSDVIGAVTGEGADRVFEVTEGNEKLEGFEGLWYRSYWIVKVEHVTGDGPPVN